MLQKHCRWFDDKHVEQRIVAKSCCYQNCLNTDHDLSHEDLSNLLFAYAKESIHQNYIDLNSLSVEK